MIRRQARDGSRAGSAEERRYADASRAVKRFLDMPWAEQASPHVIGPVRHAARYNFALRQADAADSQDQVRLRSQVDVAGFNLVMNGQHVVHASRRHGRGEQEARQGQLAVELEDFSRLPRILGDPDRIEPGTSGRRGGPAAVLIKVIGSVTYRVIVEVRTRRRQIAFVTMFKIRTG